MISPAFAEKFQRALRGEADPPPPDPSKPRPPWWKAYGNRVNGTDYEIRIPAKAMFSKSEIQEAQDIYTQRKHKVMWFVLQALGGAMVSGINSRLRIYVVGPLEYEHVKALATYMQRQSTLIRDNYRRDEMHRAGEGMFALLENTK